MASMVCVTTRFRLRRVWSLVPIYLSYRRMRRDLAVAPGLIRHAFLLQSPLVCCTLSVWESEAAVQRFANVRSHVSAVRSSKRLCRDIWSAYWHLDAVSAYANRWEGGAAWPELVPHSEQPWRLVPPSAPAVRERALAREGTPR
jgi:hypothetical protein